jgi:imidazolonepropionase-like amidohydrolase
MTDPMNKHLFTNITVLDCSGDEPFKGEVLVEGNEIVAVARKGKSLQRDGADIIDGGDGMTLMPGLVESHAHLSIENTDDLAALGRMPPEEHTLLTMHNARLYLDHGITSCISAASAKPRLDVVIRNAIEKGEIPGPRLLAATPWLTVTSGLGDMRTLHMPEVQSMALMADGPEEYRRLTRELIREGVDIIKLVISGDSFVPHAASETTIMSEEEVAAAAEVAHAHGKRLSAHARSAESIKRCVRHGIKVVYHANYADEEALDMLEANKDWLFVSPNIGFTAIAAYEGSDWFTEEQVKAMGFREELESAVKGIKELMETRRENFGWRRLRFHDHSARSKCSRLGPLHPALRYDKHGVHPHNDKEWGGSNGHARPPRAGKTGLSCRSFTGKGRSLVRPKGAARP